MMRNRVTALLAAGILSMTMLAGCTESKNSGDESSAEVSEGMQEPEEERPEIGLSVDSFVIERWIRDRDVFVATANDLGAQVNVQDAGGDADEQINQIRYLIEKGMDVIVIVARDCNSLSDVILEAKNAGIHVISYDRMIYNSDTDLYISFDNRQVGVLMAEALTEALPDGGEIFMIQGSPDDNNIYEVRDGFDSILSDSNLEVVYEATCEGWMAEQAIAYVEEALEEYPDVAGIMCGNDDIASQVITVLAEHQLAGRVAVVGQDGDISACQRIVEGTQYMTAFKAVEDEARDAASYAVRLAKGDTLEDISFTQNDGSYDIATRLLLPVAVTKENMDDIIIDGGYHSREDVYLNVR